MEENNNVIEELADVEELESRIAPGGGKTSTVIISA